MIENEFQYHSTKSQTAKFEQALAQMDSAKADSAMHPLLQQAEKNALPSQLESLRTELAEYETLLSGQQRTFAAESFEELPRILIQARIASGLTQMQLAERLGLKEQQIQRYEATGYAAASLKRVNQVIRAPGVNVREEFTLA